MCFHNKKTQPMQPIDEPNQMTTKQADMLYGKPFLPLPVSLQSSEKKKTHSLSNTDFVLPLYSLGWPQSGYVAKAVLEPFILFPSPV